MTRDCAHEAPRAADYEGGEDAIDLVWIVVLLVLGMVLALRLVSAWAAEEFLLRGTWGGALDAVALPWPDHEGADRHAMDCIASAYGTWLDGVVLNWAE
ncbi:hypothetical protein [Plastoroseomonas hellenica]|uniref:hypothetical protein n=1 Tax=Plastoroseomonas hellenica TaxID=2687306 RepID=UPI001BAE339F|nr:hypothetical protein [Plastoroseomonas hellenica]MBR0646614.1 hypothetical protein [Plastoroseomonas hellenica]